MQRLVTNGEQCSSNNVNDVKRTAIHVRGEGLIEEIPGVLGRWS